MPSGLRYAERRDSAQVATHSLLREVEIQSIKHLGRAFGPRRALARIMPYYFFVAGRRRFVGIERLSDPRPSWVLVRSNRKLVRSKRKGAAL